ncbi:uncharacterized protein [Macrobrachium rosenbergii]|uniref:uncharacterized protein n=1 Tax=Macrobrachium rosenbergii TaxID=79674 RepID=UPI0034D43C83
MEGQDILDINEKMIGELIPPIGKQLLYLREQAILKGSSPSKLDIKPGAETQSPPTGNSSEITSTPTSSTSGITSMPSSKSGQQSPTSQIDASFTDDEEMSQPHNPTKNYENPGELWNDLQNYKLPLFSPCIKTILQTRKSPQDYLPGTSNRRAVIRALTDDLVKKHIVTLSKQGYTNLLNALFSEYPHIGDPKCWRMSLRTKKKNIRMPLELNDVQILKKKFGCLGTGGRKRVAETVDEEREACKKRQKLKIDLEGPGDDEVTTLIHIDILKAKYKKGSPDLAMIARKMERTFAFRWKKINDPNLSVEDILLDFPVVRERNFLAGEAERHGIFKPLWSTT